MNNQVTIDFACKARDKGIQKAVDHADRVHKEWSEKAYEFLRIFLRHNRNGFMVEDVRNASKGVVPEPPSKRAWGWVIKRAAASGLVRKIGIQSVKNVNAHRANAAVWKRV